jgi:hypothetical protein
MGISQYQYERLAYLLEEKELDNSQLQMIDDILATRWFDHDQAIIAWLMDWLRKKPMKKQIWP